VSPTTLKTTKHMKAIQTIYADGISVEIHCDSMSESPRQWDNLTKMSLFAKGYKFPNELDLKADDYLSWDEMEHELKARHKYVFPVYMYEHGNVALSTTPFSCKWDSCKVGFAVVDDDEGMTEEQVYKNVVSEVKVYSAYLSGDVYGFIAKHEDDDEEFYSSWGFYGSHDESGIIDEIRYALADISMATTNTIIEQI
jgi:hypothetical protein